MQYALMAGTTLLWLCYLTWEMKHYKRKNDDGLRWWERNLTDECQRRKTIEEATKPTRRGGLESDVDA